MHPLKPGSHASRILTHLASGKPLTVLQSFRLFECCSLSRRIVDLKRRGHRITGELRKLPSGRIVKVYRLAS